MIFLDDHNKKVILSVRKCGLISLSHSVTEVYKNRSGSKKYLPHNLDTFEWWTNDQNAKSDFSFWKDYDVTLIIRNPYQRYVSGLRTLWSHKVYGRTYTKEDKSNENPNVSIKFKDWWEENFDGDYSFKNPHTSNWLANTKQLEYKSLEVVDTTHLSKWLGQNGFEELHWHKSNEVNLLEINMFLQENHKEQVHKFLQVEAEIYNYWLTSPYYYSKIIS